MKKLLAILLAVSVFGVFAAGCSGGAAEGDKTPDAGKTETPKAEGE